ncbi:LPS-assembly protein [Sinobacterium caligoides]|uniref:LPS-assembly protein LptD n=1 Tax=Sinobacterium caligoides TaxID=933926 RepID=A0A3N2DQH2_9GAMM|nr:LPS-assembly protein LptD [Sinobacterium caligoides]ROS01545.1 LPS-assembly protein [Sinobacterium caligoides]
MVSNTPPRSKLRAGSPLHPGFQRHRLAIAVSLTLLSSGASTAFAATPASAWQCQADGHGGWQCDGANSKASLTPTKPTAKATASSTVDASNKGSSIESSSPVNETPLSSAVEAAPTRSLATAPAAVPPASAAEEEPSNSSCGNNRELDWVPASELTQAQLATVKRGCNGMYVEPENDSPEADLKPEESPIRASANSSETVRRNRTRFTGDVAISQGSRRIFADSATAERDQQLLELDGNVVIRDNGVLMRGDSGSFNSADGTGSLDNAEFVIHEVSIRGDANLLTKSGEQTIELYDSRYTRCAPGNSDWYLQANEIDLDREEGFGSAKHAKIYVKDVPIAYVPYMTFPIDNRRRSGLLLPTLSTSKTGRGLDITQPYYFNLAENYDATLSPRYIGGRGLATELELRYLNQYSEWRLSGAQINDKYEGDEDEGEGEKNEKGEEIVNHQGKRWLVGVNEEGAIGRVGHRIDYTKVSDNDYLNDISAESLDVQRQTHLDQKAEFWTSAAGFTYRGEIQQYQTIDDTVATPYQLRPRLEMEKSGLEQSNQFNLLFLSEYSDFVHPDDKVQGQRIYLEPGISYPLESRWGFLTTTAKMRGIYYQLDEDRGPELDNTSPSTTSAMASVDAGLFFERDLELFGGSFTQTLEPRVFYLYSQYQEQDENPLFDTAELTFSYNQLFRDTRFNGHDRIDDANQVSTGITTRFIDKATGVERASFSLGQINYFDDRKIGISEWNETDYDTNSSHSDIASEVTYRLNESFRMSGDILWDNENDETKQGSLTLRYNNDGKLIVNASLRKSQSADIYAEDINGNPTDEILWKGDVNQSDLSGVVPLNDRWALIGRYNYDHTNNRSLEEIVGIEYNSCCWKTQLVYQEGIDGNNEREHGLYLYFQLKGLGGVDNGLDLDDSIVGYKEREQDDR